jgi:hypothetical protein
MEEKMDKPVESLEQKVARLEKAIETLELLVVGSYGNPEIRHRNDEAVRSIMAKHNLHSPGGKKM